MDSTDAALALERARGVERHEPVRVLVRQREQLREVMTLVATRATALGGSAEELSAVSTEMSANAEDTSTQANVVSAAAEQVSMNVQTVAVGVEEMGASIKEIVHDRAFSGPDVSAVRVVCIVETTGHAHVQALHDALRQGGMKVEG